LQLSCINKFEKEEGVPMDDGTETADLLHRAGLKRTTGRIALIELLRNSANPLTQEEIAQGLAGHGLNRVTIYRALASFIKAGLVHRIENADRTWKFEFCGCGGHGHPHFICRACGKMECLTDISLPPLTGVETTYLLETQEVYLRGLCPRCVSRR
jgi:Fur family ferric uptake transcriptional regulator